MRLKDQLFFGVLTLPHIMVILVLVKLWLVLGQPLIVTFTPHDDLLFVILAQNILDGNWLGEFTDRVLIKGVFYPLFIAFSNLIQIPLLMAQHLFYALGCVVLVQAVSPIVRNKWWLLGIFLFLLFNAFTYNYSSNGRVLRLGVYSALVVFFYATMIAILIRLRDSNLKTRYRSLIIWSMGLGVSLAALWLTREEGVWLLPVLLLYAGVTIFIVVLGDFPKVKTGVIICVLPLIIWGASLLTVSFVNYQYYGVFLTNEIKSSEFRHAYSGLLRVKSDDWLAHHPFRKDSRERIYKVSPSFKKLEPYIEGDMGREWQGGHPDINGGLFMWLLRDAVVEIGHYKHSDAPSTLAFYQSMGDEIHAACDSGQLDCETLLHPLTPPWRSEYTELLIPTFTKVLVDIVKFRHFSPHLKTFSHTAGFDFVVPTFQYVTNDTQQVDHPIHLPKLPKFYRKWNEIKRHILATVGESVYRKIPQLLFVVSLLALLYLLIAQLRRRDVDPIVISGVLLLGGLFSHVAIITVVNITSYDGAFRLGHTDYPIVLMFCICGLVAIRNELRRKRQQRAITSS
ncbi:MAG: hypothetical protein GKR95_04155 [Gammaproteobacteria bacterium]|nr:hypothetical protein [Gammaproteobacteria bacterium]